MSFVAGVLDGGCASRIWGLRCHLLQLLFVFALLLLELLELLQLSLVQLLAQGDTTDKARLRVVRRAHRGRRRFWPL